MSIVYYLLIVLSVVLFGFNFALNNEYRKLRGSSLKISMQFSLVGTLAGFIIILATNGFRIEFTPFTLIIALLKSITGIGFSFCAFKSLSLINLSVYSLFSMLGGMMLPFLQGIIFYNEPLTVEVVLCFLLICVSLALTIKKGASKKGGFIYYAGIFVLNGLSGVLSKIFASAPYEKTSVAGESILCGLCTIILASFILLFYYIKEKRSAPDAATAQAATVENTPVKERGHSSGTKFIVLCLLVSAGSGILNRLANLILQYAISFVEASVQYPMVTGGTIIVSTIICLFSKNKPTRREMISALIAFAAVSLLFIFPALRGDFV